ncbi:MAG: hypothetical protein ABIK37_05205 [candidate division WOR-3 bacterium]
MTSVTDRVEELGQQIAGAVAAHGRCREEILGRLAQFDKTQAQQQTCLELVKRDIARLGGAGAWWLKALPVGLLAAFLVGLGGFFVRQEMILKEQQAIAEDLDAMRDRWGDLTKTVAWLEGRSEAQERRVSLPRKASPSAAKEMSEQQSSEVGVSSSDVDKRMVETMKQLALPPSRRHRISRNVDQR